MSTPITFNGISYSVPAYQDTGYAQGAGNLSAYLIALSTGTLQQTGGLFALLADADFGTNFGLKAKYLISETSTPASAGVLRLAKTDAIEWRNNAGGGNLPLAINGSDQLTFNGTTVDVGGVTSITGTTNQVIASASTGAVTLSTPQDIAAASTPTFAAEVLTNATNQLGFHAANQTVLSVAQAAAGHTITVPDPGGNVNAILSNTVSGTQTIASTVNLSALSASLPLQLDVSKNIVSTAIDLSTSEVTGNLGVTHLNSGTAASSSTFWRGDGTWSSPAGSGTVNSGTAGQLAYYASSTNAVSGDADLVTTTGVTTSLSVINNAGSGSSRISLTGTGVTTAGISFAANATVFDISSAAASTLSFIDSTNSVTFLQYTHPSAGLLTSGVVLAMGNNKITGLANGSASSDAAAFGQIFTGFQAPVQGLSSTALTTQSNTYVATNSSASITPTSSSHRIKVTVSATIAVASNAVDMSITLQRGATNLGPGGTGAFVVYSIPSGTNIPVPCSFTYIDSPATTSSTTYAVYVKADAAVNVIYGFSSTQQVITLEEIV